VYEADVRPPERYMMERFITAPVRFGGTPDARACCDAQMKPDPHYRPSLKLASLDIETTAQGELYSIALEGCGERQVYMLGPPNGDDSGEVDFQLEYCDSRTLLLKKLNDWFARHDPDAIIGWNVVQFDLRVLHEHARQLGVPLKLGRGGEEMQWREHGSGNHYFASAAGRLIIDGIEALRSATWSFPSFSLENVAQTCWAKASRSTTLPAHGRNQPHVRRGQTGAGRYNLKDCELVTRIFANTELLTFLERASVTGLPVDRRAARGGVHPPLHAADAPPGLRRAKPRRAPPQASPGGFVMDSQPGLYESVLVLDYKSLYPSIIRTFLIDPVGLIEGLKHPEDSESVPGFRGTFSRTRHCLPAIVARVAEGRETAKREHNAPLSQALKIIMNAFYGVLGSSGCRFSIRAWRRRSPCAATRSCCAPVS
jgi:DNA polymerase-2